MNDGNIHIERNPPHPATAAPAQTDAEAIRKQRSELHQRFAESDALDQAAKAHAAVPVPDQETVEHLSSIDVTLPDGRIIEFGPPEGVSLTIQIARILGDESLNISLASYARVLLCVRSINGVKLQPITNKAEAWALADKIGDEALAMLTMLNYKYWSQAGRNDLPVIKKNLRKS